MLYTAKIKLKTLESQGLVYHKLSIHGHYVIILIITRCFNAVLFTALHTQVRRARAPFCWLCGVTCLGTVFSVPPLHLPPHSTMPALDQNTIFPLNSDDSFLFPNAGLLSPRHSPLRSKICGGQPSGFSRCHIRERVGRPSGPESAWRVTYS